MAKIHLTTTVDEDVFNTIRLKPELRGKISSLINDFLKNLCEITTPKQEQKQLLINKLESLNNEKQELIKNSAILESQIKMLEELETEEKAKRRKDNELMVDALIARGKY
jgi:hypothetical protein